MFTIKTPTGHLNQSEKAVYYNQQRCLKPSYDRSLSLGKLWQQSNGNNENEVISTAYLKSF